MCTTDPFIKLKCDIILLSMDYSINMLVLVLLKCSVLMAECAGWINSPNRWVGLSYEYWTEPNAGPELKAKDFEQRQDLKKCCRFTSLFVL